MDNNIKKSGEISVETQHIFPIIKKWLYSEKEIFLREIVSNACDAVTKLKRLSSLGHVRDIEDDFKITVKIDKEQKTLSVCDNGIGMTEEELDKYICQIALSGALDFIEKYESQDKDANSNGIIGHFGLGFYSSFMVSDTVDVITKSYLDSPALKWVCTEAGEYEIHPCDKAERGTEIVMHICEGEEEFLEEYKIRDILNKYCSFMPTEIYLEVVGKEDDKSEEDGEKGENTPINDVHPLWQKQASECNDEDYKNFYKKVFADYKDPLFQIHINADYPLNFKGILYFPKLNHEFENMEGQVKLYYNQVFVADNIKEVIPDFLLMLKGVLDCPELPLNVSRSYLQNSGYVSKISAHIVKKVADKINSLFNLNRSEYEAMWNDIKIFVEYGCMRDRKFFDRVKNSIIFKTTSDTYTTLPEYLENAKDKNGKTVYYTNDPTSQAQYISMFAKEGIEILVLDKVIDTQFIGICESENEGVKFVRIDADIASSLKEEGDVPENEKLASLFKSVSGDENLKVEFTKLKDEKTPALLNLSEQSRRLEDMMKLYSRGEAMPDIPKEMTFIINTNSSLINKLIPLCEKDDPSANIIAKQIYTLALISQRQLSATELQDFLDDSFSLLEKI